MTVTVRCKRHPKYKAVYHHQTDCKGCQFIWELRRYGAFASRGIPNEVEVR